MYIRTFFKAMLTLAIAVMIGLGCTDTYDVREGIREVDVRPSVSAKLITEGLGVKFVDSSSNVTSRVWNFTGGVPDTSTEESLVVRYPEASEINGEGGNTGFPVTFEATKSDGTIETRNFNVIVYPKIRPTFEPSVKEVKFGKTITFTNTTVAAESEFEESKELDSIAWTFEGGTPSFSNDPNPEVTYPEIGDYDVSLYVSRRSPPDSALVTMTDFVSITEFDCSESPNLVNCFNWDIEDDNLAQFNASSESVEPLDRNANLSVTDIRAFGEGANSLLYKYEEPAGSLAFTAHFIDFTGGLIEVAEDGSYTISMDHFGEVTGGTQYVMLLGFVNTETEEYQNEFIAAAPADQWNNVTQSYDLAAGTYYVRVQMFNPGFGPDQRIDFYMDNFIVTKN